MIKIGLIGKTNAGKTTFFNAATLLSAEVSTYPFTTKEPNIGRAYIQTICVCKELGVKDNPQNSFCIDGWRFIPVELIDLPGLIKGAWLGKGLGTAFLSIAAQADVLLHVVDASGSVDSEGRLTKPGFGNPILDVYDVEEELTRWFAKTIERSSKKIIKQVDKGGDLAEAIAEVLAGLKIKLTHVAKALEASGLKNKRMENWFEKDYLNFAKELRSLSKPTIIIANKMDIGPAEENFKKLSEEFKEIIIVPCSSDAELALRRAEQKGFIKYIPGEEAFKVVDESKLTKEQKWALNYVQQRVLSKFIGTGVQFALNLSVFKLLGMNVVYPVEDAEHLSDKKGNVLPDAFLVSKDSTIKDLAAQIHTELAQTLIYGIDARTGLRLPVNYTLRDRDIIHIVAASKRK
ncbi:redox-regulated ATPase YchF [Candidatus Bathyarchaeota archaeon]|nr:redox-regulated ATPase YchF [Candidatus Bathyarchaeota archaeon]